MGDFLIGVRRPADFVSAGGRDAGRAWRRAIVLVFVAGLRFATRLDLALRFRLGGVERGLTVANRRRGFRLATAAAGLDLLADGARFME